MSTITAPRAQGYSFRQLQSAFIKTIAISGAMLSEMSLLDHLEELRRRILKALLAVAVALIACWTYTVQLIDIAQRPVRGVQGIQLIAIEATEIFLSIFSLLSSARSASLHR
jgi:Sec-independent protein secretion pathway component TatC